MVSTTIASVEYLVPVGSTNYSYTFPFFSLSADYIKASINGVPCGVSVTLNPNRIGGTVTLHTRPLDGAKVRIWRDTPTVQNLNLDYNSELPAEALMYELDRRCCIEQEQRERTEKIIAQNEAILALKQGPKGDKGDTGPAYGELWTEIFVCSTDGTVPAIPTATTVDPNNPVPPGYSDYITDPTLGVWYHSRAKVNTQGTVLTPWQPWVRVTQLISYRETIFKLSASKPPTPIGTDLPPPGWVDSPMDPVQGQTRWASSVLVVDGVPQTFSEPVEWGGKNGKDGEDGWSSHELYCVSATQPPTPPSAPAPTGWYQLPSQAIANGPAGVSRMWWTRTYINEAETEVDGYSVPIEVGGERGKEGNFPVTAYYYGPGTVQPATPSATTKVPSPAGTTANPVGWYDEIDTSLPIGERVWFWSDGMYDTEAGQMLSATWTVPQRTTGTGANTTISRFCSSATQPATPSNPPASPPWYPPDTFTQVSGVPTWETRAQTNEFKQVITPWSIPIKVSGEDGNMVLFAFLNLPASSPYPNTPTTLTTSANGTPPQGGWSWTSNQVLHGEIAYMTWAVCNPITKKPVSGESWHAPIRVSGESGSNGAAGERGEPGPPPTLVKGQVSIGGSNAADFTFTAQASGAYKYDVVLPRGEKGDVGLPSNVPGPPGEVKVDFEGDLQVYRVTQTTAQTTNGQTEYAVPGWTLKGQAVAGNFSVFGVRQLDGRLWGLFDEFKIPHDGQAPAMFFVNLPASASTGNTIEPSFKVGDGENLWDYKKWLFAYARFGIRDMGEDVSPYIGYCATSNRLYFFCYGANYGNDGRPGQMKYYNLFVSTEHNFISLKIDMPYSVAAAQYASPEYTDGSASQTHADGDNVTLYARFTGFPRPTFVWKKDDIVVANASDYILNLVVSAETVGTYVCTATNQLGSATSNPISLTISADTPTPPSP